MLAVLGKAEFFITVDLKSGYWQIPIDENDKEIIAFTCHRGLYEYNVVLFGLANATGIFQELMPVVLQDLGNFAMVYLDDIIIFSSSVKEYIRHIQIVFDRLRQHQLKLKLSKCKFLQKETQYLDFIISESGIKADPDKVHVKSLSTVPLLAYPDTSKTYILYTDTSDDCIGACLCQHHEEGEKPIYYLSYKLMPSQTKLLTIGKEAFAMFYALEKLDQYLHDPDFIIRMDHKHCYVYVGLSHLEKENSTLDNLT